jgi:hypothetical protein
MSSSPHTGSRSRLLSIATVGGLAAAGTLLAITPAHAADHVITPGQLDVSETRATGHNTFVADGVHVWTEGATSTDKAAGYFAVDQDLADVGEPSMDSVRTDPTTTLLPGMQLVTDFDGNGTVDGILVGEPTYASGANLYGDNWWLSNGSKQFVKDLAPSHGGGFGSDNNGTLDQWRAAFPDAHVMAYGWSVGSGVRADTTIRSMTLGADTYTFVGTGAPIAPPITVSTAYRTPVSIDLSAIDPDGGAVTYKISRADHGYARLARGSHVATFRPSYGFAGDAHFTYTATDDQGESTTSTVTVTVEKAASSVSLSGRNTYARGVAYVSGRVDSAGNPRGGVLTISEDGDTVATYVLRGHSFRIRVGSGIPAGEHTYDVSFGGSATAGPASGSTTIVVR